VKTLKTTIISMMMLTLLFLPAMQVKMPVVEACVPSEPVEVQEITGSEKQQIVNMVLDSSKFSIAVEWLKTKNIEIDTSFEAIKILKVNSSKYSGYIAIIPQKTDETLKNIEEMRIGGIFAALDKSGEISSIMASYIKPTVNSRSLIVETLTINSEENYLTYILMTRGRTYKIEKPYETTSTKISEPQNLEIEVMGTCEDHGLESCSGPGGGCPYGYYCHEICLEVNWWCIFWNCGACATLIAACIAAIVTVDLLGIALCASGAFFKGAESCYYCFGGCCVETAWCCTPILEGV